MKFMFRSVPPICCVIEKSTVYANVHFQLDIRSDRIHVPQCIVAFSLVFSLTTLTHECVAQAPIGSKSFGIDLNVVSMHMVAEPGHRDTRATQPHEHKEYCWDAASLLRNWKRKNAHPESAKRHARQFHQGKELPMFSGEFYSELFAE